MLLVSLLGGLGLLALPALARRAGRRLHPAEWAPLCVGAVAGGALLVVVSLVLYALPTLADSAGLPQLAEFCGRMLAPQAPDGSTAGWAAATAALALAMPAAMGWSRARRALSRAQFDVGPGPGRCGGHELLILPTAQPLAVGLPGLSGGGRGRIVVSEGLLEVLSPAEVDAVLAHEAAHLDHGHHRYLAVAATVDHAFAWFPPAGRSTATVRLALERWADETAAAHHGRGVVRSALLAVTAALLAPYDEVDPAVAMFSAAETIGERLDALEVDPPNPLLGPHLLVNGPQRVALGAMAVVLSCWAGGIGEVLATIVRCPA